MIKPLTDWAALNLIADVLNGHSEWNIETGDAVAELVRMTGRQVRRWTPSPGPKPS